MEGRPGWGSSARHTALRPSLGSGSGPGDRDRVDGAPSAGGGLCCFRPTERRVEWLFLSAFDAARRWVVGIITPSGWLLSDRRPSVYCVCLEGGLPGMHPHGTGGVSHRSLRKYVTSGYQQILIDALQLATFDATGSEGNSNGIV